MNVDHEALTLRSKILGVLLRDARMESELSLETCAEMVGAPVERYESYELGEISPSLPELECLAYNLKVPLAHFWEKQTLASGDGHEELPDAQKLIALRQRMIGAQLRKARLEAGVTLERLAEYLEVEEAEIIAYELGEEAVPLPLLEALCEALNRSIREFHDQFGPVGQWQQRHQAMQDFSNMPLDLQVFISKPINRPYLDLAIRMSEMSVERLRSVAEGLLEITY